MRDLTRRLGEAGNTCVTKPEVLSAAAAWAKRLLGVPGTELVKRTLMVAVTELHIEDAVKATVNAPLGTLPSPPDTYG